MTQNIDQQIQDLEAKTKQLTADKLKSDAQANFERIVNEYKGHVKVRVMKTYKESRHIVITYYEDFQLTETLAIKVSSEIIQFDITFGIGIHDKRAEYNWWLINGKNHKIEYIKTCLGDYGDGFNDPRSLRSIDYSWKTELTLEEFEAIRDYVVALQQGAINMLKTIKNADWIERIGGHSDRMMIENTAPKLDVPHIVVDKDKSFFFPTSCFKNDTVILVTDNSIKFFEQYIANLQNDDIKSGALVASFGERYRQRDMQPYYDLLESMLKVKRQMI